MTSCVKQSRRCLVCNTPDAAVKKPPVQAVFLWPAIPGGDPINA
jgi:hypothetical protein